MMTAAADVIPWRQADHVEARLDLIEVLLEVAWTGAFAVLRSG